MAALVKKCRHGRGLTGAARERAWRRCECVWYADAREDGRRVYVPLGADRDSARARLAIITKPKPSSGRPRDASFTAVAARWEAVVRTQITPRAADNIGYRLVHARKRFGPVDCAAITAADLQELEATLIARGMSHYYAVAITSCVQRVIQFAVDAGLADAVPKIRRRPHRRAERPYFTREQLAMIWTSAPRHDLVPALRVMAATGMRGGELLALKGGDVDREANTIRVRESKTPAGRRVISVPEGVIALVPVRAPDERVWAYDRRSLWGVWRKCLSRAGMPGCGMHALRHSNAAWRVASGHDLQWVANQLGHSSPAITLAMYAHHVPHQRQDITGLSDLAG